MSKWADKCLFVKKFERPYLPFFWVNCVWTFELVLWVTGTCVIGWLFSLQSAALQKKLRHLEVQVNNEKQVKDEIEHKYRYSRNLTWVAFLQIGTPEQSYHHCQSSCSCWSAFSLQSCSEPSRQSFQRTWGGGKLVTMKQQWTTTHLQHRRLAVLRLRHTSCFCLCSASASLICCVSLAVVQTFSICCRQGCCLST